MCTLTARRSRKLYLWNAGSVRHDSRKEKNSKAISESRDARALLWPSLQAPPRVVCRPLSCRLMGEELHSYLLHGSSSSGVQPPLRPQPGAPRGPLRGEAPEPLRGEAPQPLRRASSDGLANGHPGLLDRASLQGSNKRPRSEGGSPSGSKQLPPQIHPMSFDYCTALHLAAYYGHWPVIQQLAESGKCDPVQLFAARNAQVRGGGGG